MNKSMYDYVISLPVLSHVTKDFVVYRTVHNDSGMVYVGKHKFSHTPDDNSYIGSGVLLNKAIKILGKSKFTKTILFEYNTNDEASNIEKSIVNYEVKHDPRFYNIQIGGQGGNYNSLFWCNNGLKQFRKPMNDIINDDSLTFGPLFKLGPNLGTVVYNNGCDQLYIHKNEPIPEGFVKGRINNPTTGLIWVNKPDKSKMLINPDLLDEYIVAGWIRGFDATNKLCLHANTKLAEKRALGLLNTYETNYQPKQSTLAGDEGRILLDRLLANGEIVLNNHKHNLRFYENLNKFSHYDVSLILLENGIIVNKFSSASRVVRQYIIKLNSIEE